jgi:opacity protein-like surface antigen
MLRMLVTGGPPTFGGGVKRLTFEPLKSAQLPCASRAEHPGAGLPASFGLFTGQIGWAANNVLFYVKGGAAVVSDRYRFFDTVTGIQVVNGVDDTRWGATVGAGLEYGFAPNWSVGVEYNHIFLEDRNVTFLHNGVAGPAGTCSEPTPSVKTSISSQCASTTASALGAAPR